MDPSTTHKSWMHPAHGTHLDTLDRFPTNKLVKLNDQYNEFQLFRSLVGDADCRTFSDVGCATGHSYKYVRSVWPSLEYKGFDISKAAIDHASALFSQGKFQVLDGQVASVSEIESDIVFCRDVMHHQPNPREFLSDLYDKAKKYLVMRVRTREVGETVYDVSLSCQYSYGSWVPFIVFNTLELTEIISSFNPAPVKITVRRHPTILGGQQSRFVPKELYYPETDTAESALLIQKGTGESGTQTQVNVETCPEGTYRDWRIKWARKIGRGLGL